MEPPVPFPPLPMFGAGVVVGFVGFLAVSSIHFGNDVAAEVTPCPTGKPYMMKGPVEVKVGYGQVYVANATEVARFPVPEERRRELCQEDG